MMRGFRRSLALLATGSIFAAAAAAQDRPANLPPGAIVQPMVRDDGSELRRHLTTLADNPRSVDALIGAGRAAMRMGDVEAALTFFGRANELSPRDARVKAGMASGLLQMGQPRAAMSLIAEALALGAPEVEIAGDRGLAYDLLGDPRRAQQDYLIVLQRRGDAEIKRRLALSLAISGRRDAALRLIDDQLRANDRAGWRTQAFVLALTGDAAGASRTAQGIMLPGQAEAMAPFLARLAALSPSQKAMAVHLGRFPAGGQAMGGPATADTTADPRALALAMGGAPAAATPPPPRDTAPAPTRRRADRGRETADRSQFAAPRNERRRRAAERQTAPAPATPGAVASAGRAAGPAPAPPPAATQVAEASGRWAATPSAGQPSQQPSAPQPQPQPQPSPPPPQAPPAQQPAAQPSQIASTPPSRSPVPQSAQPPAQSPLPPSGQPLSPAGPRPIALPPSEPAVVAARSGAGEATPGFSLQTPGPAPAPGAGQGERPALADIAELVRTLPAEDRSRPAAPFQAPPPRSAPAAEAPRATARPAPARPAQPTHPSRHWVQIAGGANRAALPREFARLREQAPAQLGRRAAYTAALRATNRLLVGPFGSAREAQAFVNQLAQHNVAAFAWTSEAGEEIVRLQAR